MFIPYGVANQKDKLYKWLLKRRRNALGTKQRSAIRLKSHNNNVLRVCDAQQHSQSIKKDRANEKSNGGGKKKPEEKEKHIKYSILWRK